MREFNLRHASFKQALLEAKDVAKTSFAARGIKVTNQFIANLSSIEAANVARYFSEYDDYLPSPEKIPALCRALGNTILADWVQAQVEDMKPRQHISNTTELAGAIMQTTTNNGKLAQLARVALEDGEINQKEAMSLQAKLLKNSEFLKDLADNLEPLARGGQRGQVMRFGSGWQNVTIPDGVK